MLRFLRRPRPQTRSFSLPSGIRAYAIGDIHGCDELFARVVDRIDADDAARGPARTILILLGDLIDRGPQSAQVVARARMLASTRTDVRLVKGNHEEVFVAAARGDTRSCRGLMGIGGDATLRSYGLDDADLHSGSFADLGRLLLDRIPRDDIDFLDAGERWIELGDYLFVHAGIRPGRALRDQRGSDLRWIREPFLSATRNDGRMVIHGHTPTDGPDIAEDRIGVDTRAYDSGILTAIGIEGHEHWFLTS